MLVPGAEEAILDIRKLRDYCLNSFHDEGKHKAKLFERIRIGANDSEVLRDILLKGIKGLDATI